MMKRWLIVGVIAAAMAASPLVLARGSSHSSGSRAVHVKAHVTKNGTYVPGHERTAPNSSKLDNWSSKGNVNPYTGKGGTKDPAKP